MFFCPRSIVPDSETIYAGMMHDDPFRGAWLSEPSRLVRSPVGSDDIPLPSENIDTATRDEKKRIILAPTTVLHAGTSRNQKDLLGTVLGTRGAKLLTHILTRDEASLREDKPCALHPRTTMISRAWSPSIIIYLRKSSDAHPASRCHCGSASEGESVDLEMNSMRSSKSYFISVFRKQEGLV